MFDGQHGKFQFAFQQNSGRRAEALEDCAGAQDQQSLDQPRIVSSAQRSLERHQYGDNNRGRAQIRIYRIPEPQPLDATTGPAESWVGVYPDGPHDAEALLVSTAGQLYVVTKEDTSRAAIAKSCGCRWCRKCL